MGLLLWQGSDAADSLGLEMLRYHASELAHHLVREGNGLLVLDLPPDLARAYGDDQSSDLYAIKANSGQILASGQEFSDVVAQWHIDPAPSNFRLEDFGPRQEDYYGLTVIEDSVAGPVTVAVAHTSDADAIAVAMLQAFAQRIAWIIPLFTLVTLLIGVWSIRVGLSPVAAISRRAAEIDPRKADVRLPVAGLPTELEPLVNAVNLAFDRLQEGFAVQRRVTANAAHELRTPLTMLTAGLDELPDGPSVAKLRVDVARMNRLVSQLLRMSRLDALPVNLEARVDLGLVAAGVVEYLAPWAISQDRAVGLESSGKPVLVRGNAEEIGDAIRNLVENAVLHTPAGTEVTVRVSDGGSVIVDDKGPGIPERDRQHIFARFWRGKGAAAPGAGLGLSIVTEIMRVHGGTVDVGDAPGGGASFRLSFRSA
ncbi:MAG: ATP-binding protein [Steroidobacteraceae bacterium]